MARRATCAWARSCSPRSTPSSRSNVVHHPKADDGSKPEHWSVSLYLGRSTRAYIGRSRKQPAADKAAKLLATITSKPVRSVEALSHPSVIPSR